MPTVGPSHAPSVQAILKMKGDKKMSRFILMEWAGLTLMLCGGAVSSMAQPAMSRGQQQLAINYNECLSRARQALRTVGFTSDGSGNFAQGFKEASGAYITCNDVPGGGMVVNIFVATTTNDAGVPGALRQCLQAQMERPGTPSTCAGPGGCNGNGVSTADLLIGREFHQYDNGRDIGTITFDRNGVAYPEWVRPETEAWRVDLNGDLILNYRNGQTIARLTRQGQSCAFAGARDRTSRTQDGVRSELKPSNR